MKSLTLLELKLGIYHDKKTSVKARVYLIEIYFQIFKSKFFTVVGLLYLEITRRR